MSQRCLGCMEQFDDLLQVCPHCGYAVGTRAEEAIHLTPGTELYGRYTVGRVLGYGGFGVTYIGWDSVLRQKVAIKEYLPGEFSTRMPGHTQVSVFSGDKDEQFHAGMTKFIEEARHLAKFQNEEGIVKIFDSFEENSTAYIIMEYLDGETLSEYMEHTELFSEDDAVSMLLPVMESLQVVHQEGLLHRDIAPDNIFLTRDGKVKLIDFGASRYATTSHSRSLTVIIKPGYSPEEQYRSRSDQGPHTDVYALAATLYKMITGKTPPDALERRAKYENKNRDILTEPHKLAKNISLTRENAILNAMNVRVEDRTPDIGTFLKELNAEKPAKRIYGKIKKIDIYRWPTWLKILLPTLFGLMLFAGALILSGIISFSLFSENIVIPENVVTVPDVEGKQQKEALEIIRENSLLTRTGGSVNSQYVEAGLIMMQTPVGGTYLNVNDEVVLYVSSGGSVKEAENGVAVVPYLIWETLESAKEKLKQAGLAEPEVEEAYDDDVTEGQIVSQDPESGEELEEGSVIKIMVSKGPKPFDMPDLIGKTEKEAEEQLTKKGIIVRKEYASDNNVPEGTVIEQNVKSGTTVKKGDEVILTVSSGKETVKVENVVGKTQQQAKEILEKQGFKVNFLENFDVAVEKGNVISQTPEAGSSQLYGSEITVYISKGKPVLKVTLDATGGSVSPGVIEVYTGSPYTGLPVPSRDGYVFEGWFNAPEGGTQYAAESAVTATTDHTLYAHWRALGQFTVTLDAAGGSVSPGSITVTEGGAYGNLPAPARDGFIFNGWFTAPSGGNQVGPDTPIIQNANHTLFAVWTAQAVTVHLDATGGSVSPEAVQVTPGGTYGNLPVPTRAGYTFLDWYDDPSGGNQIIASTPVTNAAEHTLYARWAAATVTVNLDATGGSVSPGSIQVNIGGTYGDLPVPTREGYIFLDWCDAPSGGNQIIASTPVTNGAEHTLYATWAAATVTVHLDATGGSVSPGEIQVSIGGSYGDLPVPTREGYIFLDWSDAPSGGNQIIPSTPVTNGAEHTLYATWIKE